MTSFKKEDLLAIAQLSALELHDHEITMLTQQISGILSYVEQLQEVDTNIKADAVRNVNVFREDVIQSSSADAVLGQAPDREGRYFVVPSILE